MRSCLGIGGLWVLATMATGCSEHASPDAATAQDAAVVAAPETAQQSSPAGAGASDPKLVGVWIPKTYVYNGKPHPIDDGLVIITQQYLIANAIYDLSETKKPKPDANANYGTYVIKAPGQLVMDQAMQLHWRSPGGEGELVEGDGTFFNQDVPEEIHYEVDGDTLTFKFQVPGDQRWVLTRATGESCSIPLN
jgi:hypothetical protein